MLYYYYVHFLELAGCHGYHDLNYVTSNICMFMNYALKFTTEGELIQ